jgi:uncharacterized protein YgbK (DUF1537 family)
VLDDDPTGSQTVHGCLLLTRWDIGLLREVLADSSPLFFILTNTRGMHAARAASVTREVCRSLKGALSGTGIVPILVSRSDSTLRGHYPIETDVMAEDLGPFDAHFLVPAFIEGGRVTRGSVHYLKMDGLEVPVHQTEFARDSVFGYSTSFLPAYVEEKTRGRIRAEEVQCLLLDEVRTGVFNRLMELRRNTCVAVDAETQDDLNRFAADVRAAVAGGKRFLFRSAASLLTALAELPPQPIAPEHMGCYARGLGPGAILVGSHVQKTSRQLEQLLRLPGLAPIEVMVERLPEGRDELFREINSQIARAFDSGRTPVIYTSRRERQFSQQEERVAFGQTASALLVDIVRTLPAGISYLISKGGITSNDVLSEGLALGASRVLGQVLPGCSMVVCPKDHPRFPAMPVVIFPGNVGDDQALAEVYLRLSGRVA